MSRKYSFSVIYFNYSGLGIWTISHYHIIIINAVIILCFYATKLNFVFRIDMKKNEKTRDGFVCKPMREDYFECLHNKREHAMVRKVNEQEKLNAAGGGNDGH